MFFENISGEIFIFTAIMIVGLLLRLVQYARFKFPGGGDIFFHLLYKEKLGVFFKNTHYPYLFHLLFQTIKKILRLSDRKLILLSAVPDLITGLTAYIVIRGYYGVASSLIVLALFLTTPRLVHQSIFTPRSMGLLMYTLSLLALTMPFPLNALSIPFVSLTALTHRLSIHTLFFTAAVYSFFDVRVIFYFVLGLLVAFLISKRRYYYILRSHLSYLKLMITKRQFRYPNREHLVFIGVPYAIVAPLCLLSLLEKVMPEPIQSWLCWLIVPVMPLLDQPFGPLLLTWGLVPFLLVFLWRWGDSYRFVIYSALPLALLYSEALMSNRFLFFLLPVILSGNVILSLYFTRRNTLTTKSFLRAVAFLSQVEDDGFCSPERYYWAVKYFTNRKGWYIRSRDPSSIMTLSWEDVSAFKYVIVPTAMIDDFKLKHKTRLLFSNGKWTVGRVESVN